MCKEIKGSQSVMQSGMQSKDGFKTVKDVALYFHSSFRNVGLYTSLSLASLAAANTYAKDSPTYHPLFVFSSAILLVISLLLNIFLCGRVRTISTKLPGVRIWLTTIYMMFVLQVVLLVFGGHLVYAYMRGS